MTDFPIKTDGGSLGTKIEKGKTPVRLKLEISSSLSELARVREFVRTFCCYDIKSLIDEDQVWQLELAVHEATVNVIKHAYHGQDDKPIQIEAHAASDQIIFRLNHWGGAFDRESVPPARRNGLREGGFGLVIIERFVDEVIYTCDEDGKSSILLVKGPKRHGREEFLMDFPVEKIGEVAIVVLPGETLEAGNTIEFKRHITPLLEGNSKMVFDLSQIRFIDSTGFGAILSCLKKLREKGGDLKVCCATNQISALFRLMGFHHIFGIFDSREEGAKAFQG